jgi:DnaJ-class molecular chaperone
MDVFVECNIEILKCKNITFKTIFLSFFQALCGTRVEVPTLSGDRMVLNLQDEIIRPTTVKRVPGRGMPMPKDTTKRGDLVVI